MSFTSKSNGNNSIENKLDGAKDHLKNTADEILTRGMAGAESLRDSLHDTTGRLEDSIHTGWKSVKNTSSDVQGFVKKYPVYTAVGAIALSFLAGAMYGKSNRK